MLATVQVMPTSLAVLRRPLDSEELEDITDLLGDATATQGQRPIGDQAWLDLQHDAGSGSIALLSSDTARGLIGFALLSRHLGIWTLELVVRPRDGLRGRESSSIARELLGAALQEVSSEGGGRVDYWVHFAGDDRDREARAVGFVQQRDLLQLGRTLPVPPALGGGTASLEVRSFRPGYDEHVWLQLNNRAFASHPEQGGWDVDRLSEREREPWFDPEGFLLHFDGDRLAASCWTKVHRELAPPTGEIYVISVDPDYQGTGLGKRMTLTALDWLSDRRGLRAAMLYVDADNRSAHRLYNSLGFVVHHVDRAYSMEVPGAS